MAIAVRVLDNYVGGRWTPSSSSDGLDVTNPATGEVLARVPLSTSADLDAAVQAARGALPAWRAVGVPARARKLFELREALVARQDELARSVTTEMGKTIVDARAEVGRTIEMVEAACAIPTTMQGRILEDVSRNVDAETIRQPVGVCAAIVPFNFPAMVPFWFLPFAIACGNAGQRCMAGSVLVTVGDAHEQLMPALIEATRELQVGDGIEEGIDVGPVISDKAQERITGWIERADRVLVDGRETAYQAGC